MSQRPLPRRLTRLIIGMPWATEGVHWGGDVVAAIAAPESLTDRLSAIPASEFAWAYPLDLHKDSGVACLTMAAAIGRVTLWEEV